MPQYHSLKVDRFKIEAMPKSLLRRVFRFWPYFVGNRVEFKLSIVDLNSIIDSTSLHLFEIFNGEEKTLKKFDRAKITDDWNNIVGNPIDREGDVIYRIGVSSKSSSSQTIFSAHVINTDRWSLGCLGLLFGTIGTIVAGIILGFIEISPAWRVWIQMP